jgi:hypothetical protein
MLLFEVFDPLRRRQMCSFVEEFVGRKIEKGRKPPTDNCVFVRLPKSEVSRLGQPEGEQTPL